MVRGVTTFPFYECRDLTDLPGKQNLTKYRHLGSFEAIFGIITENETVKQITEEHRANIAEDYKKDKRKEDLPAVTFQVKCKTSRRTQNNIEAPLPYTWVDLDYIDLDKLNYAWDMVTSCSFTRLAYHTASGKGIRAVIEVPIFSIEDYYAGRWLPVNKYYSEMTGLNYDGSTGDIVKLSFLAYDPDAYYNPESEIFYIGEGYRNNALTSYAGTVAADVNVEEEEFLTRLKQFNSTMLRPPSDQYELENIYKSMPEWREKAKVNKKNLDENRAKRIEQGWLVTDKGGIRQNSIRNAELALTNLNYDARLKYNEFSRNLECDSQPIEDFLFSVMKKEVEEMYGEDGYFPNKDAMDDAVILLSHEQSYDPIKDFAAHPQWDGISRYREFCEALHQNPDDELEYETALLLLRGVVGRALNPGCVFPYVPCIQSAKQGTGKTTLLRILALGYFSEGMPIEGFEVEKRQSEKIRGKLIVEVSDIRSLTEAKQAAIRELGTREDFYVRDSFARMPSQKKWQGIAVITTNYTEIFTDPELRRNTVISIPDDKEVDLIWLRENIQQLYAETATKLVPDEEIRLPSHLWAKANEKSKEFRVEADFSDLLIDQIWGEPADGDFEENEGIMVNGRVPVAELKAFARMHNVRPREMKAEMAKLGFKGPKSMGIGGKVVKGYEHDSTDPPRPVT